MKVVLIDVCVVRGSSVVSIAEVFGIINLLNDSVMKVVLIDICVVVRSSVVSIVKILVL